MSAAGKRAMPEPDPLEAVLEGQREVALEQVLSNLQKVGLFEILLLEGQRAILAELAAQRAMLDALREAVEAQQKRRTRPQDQDAAPFLRTIFAAVGDRAFTAAELAAHAALPVPELQAAILAHVESMQPRRIGKSLRFLEGRRVQGLTVRRVGEDRGGAIWLVEGVRE